LSEQHSIPHVSEERPTSGLLSQAPERALLVGVDMPDNTWPVEESLDELVQLATTAGVTCVGRVIQRLSHPQPGTVLGSGKVQEVADLARYHSCDAVIFDLELSPRQHRNLERELEIQVIDRTALILIIFGQRAHTREGRLQVELAQVEYDLPRLARQWSHLSRQRGGTQQRGEGEKQIEVDRRMLNRQKEDLLEDLEQVRNQRQRHRERRPHRRGRAGQLLLGVDVQLVENVGPVISEPVRSDHHVGTVHPPTGGGEAWRRYRLRRARAAGGRTGIRVRWGDVDRRPGHNRAVRRGSRPPRGQFPGPAARAPRGSGGGCSFHSRWAPSGPRTLRGGCSGQPRGAPPAAGG